MFNINSDLFLTFVFVNYSQFVYLFIWFFARPIYHGVIVKYQKYILFISIACTYYVLLKVALIEQFYDCHLYSSYVSRYNYFM